MVPESTETIEKAFSSLKSVFGDPRKILDDRIAKLKAVGDLPPEKLANERPGFRKQEEWYLTVEGLLAEIISLGDREEDLAYHAYSEQTFNFILSLFPSDLADKLAEVVGSRKEQLESVKVKLANFSVTRETALQLRQELARIWELKNVYRKGVRQLVSDVPAEDATRLQWEKSCKELVDKVIRHKMQVLASIERVCPTEHMTEYQRKSLELQKEVLDESKTT